MKEYVTLQSETAPPEEMEVGALCEIVSDEASTVGTIEEIYEKEGFFFMTISYEAKETIVRVLN